MESDAFWIRIWLYVAVFFCVFTACVTSCTMYETSVLESMVEKGANPVEARCSIGTQSTTLCQLYFSNKR
jgi:hypothetical protein